MIVGHIGGGGSAIDTGDIGHSLRFRASNSAHVSRAYTGSTTQQKITFSFWIKRGTLGTNQCIFAGGYVGGGGGFAGDYFRFNTSNQLEFIYDDSVNPIGPYATTAVFRDPTAWLHFVIAFDTTQAVQADRCKVWVNNIQQTISNGLSLNANLYFMYGISGANARWGARDPGGPDQFFDGYMSRCCAVVDQALTPSSFAYLNTESNAWVSKTQAEVKAVVDTGGAKSHMLDFDDGTSLTTLGYDKSSKGNNWTLNNFSLTAGPTYDWMLDTPSNNFAVLNNIYPSVANITNGNLSSGTTAARGTFNSTVFDSQWFVTAGASNVTAGVIDDSGSANTTTVTANKVFAFKMTSAGALSYKNVTDAGSWTSIATGLTGNRWPYGVTAAASWNFGQQPLPEAFDTGFKALCTANLPDGETITTSGTFTGNASADGPYIDIKGVPTAMTINGNAVTFGTHADKTAFGFKVRSSSASYNAAGSNTYSITSTGAKRKYSNGQGNP